MVRCPRCGRRVPAAAPNCARHGAFEDASASDLLRSAPPEAPRVDEHETRLAFASIGYDLDRVIGRGGFGVVYAARRQSDGAVVAIKLALRDQREAAEALAREANALELVGPTAVPALYERGALLEQYFVVIEFIAGETLAEHMQRRALPPGSRELGELALSLLSALRAVHQKRLVHRDLKPENLFLTRDGVRIIDFGTVKQLDTVSGGKDDDAAGTAEYMSPEQCAGLPDVDARSDLYSVGVLLYELLAYAPPFWGRPADVRDAHRSRRAMPLSKLGYPAEIDAVVRRCLTKDRSKRYADCDSLIAALSEALASMPFEAREPTRLVMPVISEELRSSVASPSGPREKRNVSLAFFESRSGMHVVQPLVTASGGQIVQMSGAQYVVAFGHDVSDNPVRIALLAAERLIAAHVTKRISVDLAQVSVQLKPDGSRRLFSAVFTKKDRYPSESDPTGVTLTSSAYDVVPDLSVTPVPHRADRFRVSLSSHSTSVTGVGPIANPLLGRDEQLAQLLDGARMSLLGRQPSLAYVGGEAGIGKSHIFRVLALELERLQGMINVVTLIARESMMGVVPQLIPQLLKRLLDLPDVAPEDGGRALLISTLGAELGEQVWAAASFALGYIDAEHPDVRRLAAAPGALRLAIARAAGEAMRRSAQRKPLAVLIDDGHLAEDAFIDALEYAALKEASAPIWACVLARPSFSTVRPGFGTRAARTLKLTLQPLSIDHASELARRLLYPVQYVPPLVLKRLAERTQGIPRLMVEPIRGLKRDGLVRRSERGTGSYLATDELDKLPDLPIVQWNASREVESLPAQLAGHARLCSVLGSSFTLLELESFLRILDEEELPEDMQLDAAVGVERLIETGVVVRHRSGLLEFRNALLREIIYQQINEAQRAILHRAAYRTYRETALPSDIRLPRLALHAAASGARAEAADAFLALAERASKAQAYLDAEHAFGRALEYLPPEQVDRIITALRGRGLMRFRLARHEDALKDIQRAREHAEQASLLDQELELCLDESTVLDWTRDLERSAELVERVRAKMQEPTPLLLATLGMSTARVHHRRGEALACVDVGARAAELAGQLGDQGYETRVISLLMVGTDCANLGRLDDAERYLEAVLNEAQAHGDLQHLAAAHNNRAFLWSGRKDAVRLLADLEVTNRIARETGQPLLEYPVLVNLAEVAYFLEQLENATEYTKRAMELAEQLWSKDNRELGTRELLLARIALYGGDLAAAQKLAAAMRARFARPRSEDDDLAFMPSDQALLEMVELSTGSSTSRDWDALFERVDKVDMQPLEEVELIEGRALWALRCGAIDESRLYFDRALAVSREKPSLIDERVVRTYNRLFGAAKAANA